MGVIYKLQPKIKDFILTKKQTEPNLSCRKLSTLVLDKFQIKLSKSSINSLIKTEKLSMPVGRRRKVRKGLLEAQGLGALFLKAADYLVGGSYYISEAIKWRLKSQAPELLARTECLLYNPLFGASTDAALKPDSGLWFLLNQKFAPEEISSYLKELQEVSALPADIFRIISTIFQEVRSIRISLSDGSSLYLDAQLYTVWSTPQIPYDFSTTHYNIKSYMNKYFKENAPFMLFTAPGYDAPTKEFFDFMLSLDSAEKRMSNLTLYGNKLEEIEVMQIERVPKRYFVVGLWPWQFAAYRKVIKIGEFKGLYFEPLKKDFYLAEIEIELLQPTVNKRVTLKGCALKTNLNEKIKLIILSNLAAEQTQPETLANLYLSHWPNLEEAFQDFSRKIELFTYSPRFLSTQSLNLNREALPDINALLGAYLKALDLYVRWHFLPFGYEDKDFPTIKKHFYSLKARLKKQKDSFLVTFIPPQGYPFLKDLQYACRRVNERQIVFPDGQRLWYSVAST